MLGAEEASGEVLTFLDSHCEVTEGWLLPLLHRIAEDPSNVVCPVINAINPDTFRSINNHKQSDICVLYELLIILCILK